MVRYLFYYRYTISGLAHDDEYGLVSPSGA